MNSLLATTTSKIETHKLIVLLGLLCMSMISTKVLVVSLLLRPIPDLYLLVDGDHLIMASPISQRFPLVKLTMYLA